MKHSPKQLIAAVVLATLGLAAVAQTPPGPPPGGPARQERMERFDPARMQQHMQARMAKRMARLKETLQIAPAQEGAWTAWTASMQPPANWKRPDRAEFERLTTPQRIDRMHALRAERMARMDQRAEATKTFYAALNPTQQRVFDLETARHGQRGGHEGGRWGHHRHHEG
jgi:protein CpxP